MVLSSFVSSTAFTQEDANPAPSVEVERPDILWLRSPSPPLVGYGFGSSVLAAQAILYC